MVKALREKGSPQTLLVFFLNESWSITFLSIKSSPIPLGDVSSYRLRNAENYVGIHANTRAYAELFLPSTLQAWNNLPGAVRSADTLASFKHLLTLDHDTKSTQILSVVINWKTSYIHVL